MSPYFLDSSALAKRYMTETGSPWIRALAVRSAGSIIVSEITLAEVANAFAKRHRVGGLTRQERDNALKVFLDHCKTDYTPMPVTRSIIDRAVILTQTHTLRAYDAVQLATALEADLTVTAGGLNGLTFVASDNALLVAATVEGLLIDNPLSHP
ncbi:MAG TPA: type II toxin-antitoxin system VapC family toxin [Herpetosiphonaceae bacterium]|nr:type II toxin-antitoxin system VapC family toxin [Herpetosiphonaceae bacterium]